MNLRLKEVLWIWLAVITIAFSAGSYLYYFFDAEMIPLPYARNAAKDPWFFFHIAASFLWLTSGLIQLSVGPRKFPIFHRLNGLIYAILLVLGSVSIFVININLNHKTIFGVGSYPFAVFPIIGLKVSLYFLLKRDYRRHSSWMIRSMVMPALIPVYRLVAALTTTPVFYICLPYVGILVAELLIGKKLEGRLPTYALPVIGFLCAVSFWLVFRFQWNHVRNIN